MRNHHAEHGFQCISVSIVRWDLVMPILVSHDLGVSYLLMILFTIHNNLFLEKKKKKRYILRESFEPTEISS